MADHGQGARDAAAPLARVRAVCMSLPAVTERLSHGSPTWFVRDRRSFVMFMDNHHGDGRLALWCATSSERRAARLEADPESYFWPPYVGHAGWIGVRLDRSLAWPAVAFAIADAYQVVEPRTPGRGRLRTDR